ncbi:MAG TPA: iron-sulfur cluster assembly scaffold protein [Gammaproteobacteria bacterium]|nr:iron-sulfur cluster assembly scaffold protein [Gammaproteobacteria bacterium]
MLYDTDYSATVWRHFCTPKNAGVFMVDTPGVLSGTAGARKNGRVVEFQLQVGTDGQVADCRYRVYGCPATIALCSLTSERLKGGPLAAAATYNVVKLAEQLGLPAEKRAAAITVEDAIRSAAARYNSHLRSTQAPTEFITEL